MALVDLQWPQLADVRLIQNTIGCPICHFRFQKGSPFV